MLVTCLSDLRLPFEHLWCLTIDMPNERQTEIERGKETLSIFLFSFIKYHKIQGRVQLLPLLVFTSCQRRMLCLSALLSEHSCPSLRPR